MPLVYACICPPGRSPEGSRTANGLAGVAEELASFDVETIVLIASHGGQREAIGVLTAPQCAGCTVNVELAHELLARAAKAGVRTAELRRWDGALPYPVEALAGARLLVVTTSWLEPRTHFEFGHALGQAIASSERRLGIVCSTTLARGGVPAAGAFDKQYRRAIEEWDVKWLVGVDREYRRHAGEDAVAQTAVLMGALSAYRIQTRVLSYEASSAGGQLVAAIDVLGRRMRERTETKASTGM
jgi:hypothetical protein